MQHAFKYNNLQQLTQINLDSAAGTLLGRYRYDADGKRISRSDGAGSQDYQYLGDDIIAGYPTGQYQNPLWRTVHGGATDDPLLRITNQGTQTYHGDGLGSIVGLSNHQGLLQAWQRFDAWGNRLNGQGDIPQYGYTGREPDVAGLIYYRARWYDPSIGRFTQRDPIGLQGGINQYGYVGQNPINLVDPMGLLAQAVQPVKLSSYVNNSGPVMGSGGQSLRANMETMSDWSQPACGIGDLCAGNDFRNQVGTPTFRLRHDPRTNTLQPEPNEAQLTAGGGESAVSRFYKGMLDNTAEWAADGVVSRTGPKGVDKLHHNANTTVRDSSGRIIRHERIVSGNMTPAEQALGFPKSTLASHTEARAVTNVPLNQGDSMTITGQLPPCNSCKGYMNKASSETGASIIYQWREDGKTRRWVARPKK
ncbi:RHS repeat-associated core domain-containing protein [Chitinivorax sp. B]|uniref:RHS repeat-associated core domain-containing protein n=1 Tax=Chitinivorax sp. B TaxID=2502235 RepID=UPI002016DC7B|nr:RHS repeat-associated core domain-containing protein [Chitinivorax sp. B]